MPRGLSDVVADVAVENAEHELVVALFDRIEQVILELCPRQVLRCLIHRLEFPLLGAQCGAQRGQNQYRQQQEQAGAELKSLISP